MPSKIKNRGFTDIMFIPKTIVNRKKSDMKVDVTRFTGITGRDNYNNNPVMSQRQEGNKYV